MSCLFLFTVTFSCLLFSLFFVHFTSFLSFSSSLCFVPPIYPHLCSISSSSSFCLFFPLHLYSSSSSSSSFLSLLPFLIIALSLPPHLCCFSFYSLTFFRLAYLFILAPLPLHYCPSLLSLLILAPSTPPANAPPVSSTSSLSSPLFLLFFIPSPLPLVHHPFPSSSCSSPLPLFIFIRTPAFSPSLATASYPAICILPICQSRLVATGSCAQLNEQL